MNVYTFLERDSAPFYVTRKLALVWSAVVGENQLGRTAPTGRAG